jgi:hypothetical protein
MLSKLERVNMKFEVFKAVKIHITIFWAITQCNMVGGQQCFSGTHCLHFQGGSDLKLGAMFSLEKISHSGRP